MPTRKQLRWKTYDYSLNGFYFITICTHDRMMHFNEPISKQITEEAWFELARKFQFVQLDEFIIMPNHIHGIIIISHVGAGFPGPHQLKGGETPPLRPTLGSIVGYFKYQTTKRINQIRTTPGAPFWQRNYYERIIRNDDELHGIREYIQNNPATWESDTNNPDYNKIEGKSP